MNKEEFKSIINEEIFNKILKMIDEKKLSMNNTILFQKHMGYCKMLKNVWNPCFEISSLSRRFKQMIADEEKKNEENEESLLVDLCESYLLLSKWASLELILICVPCLLKVASAKDESEEVQTEVEMALLALSNINEYIEMKRELYFKEIKEIIEYHQEHRNLARLDYQTAWKFLMSRFFNDDSLDEVIVNELRFGREAVRELEELRGNVDWKRKEEEKEERRKDKKKELIILRWLGTLEQNFTYFKLWNAEFVWLIGSITRLFRASRDNYRVISEQCLVLFKRTTNRFEAVEELMKGGAVDDVLEEIKQPTLDDRLSLNVFHFLLDLLRKLKEKKKDEMEEVKRKATIRKAFEKMEEEGYEDIIISFYEIFNFLFRRYYHGLSLNISDYFVNI
ncbi:uncharacterized protein MONOS_2012 [Monocercomonoides exilis]|uniref:uncharacterized protein n=1 Tax=Monocercomonoides exilis TaxID=2049356 RepID=UPI00355AB1A4|nr:hypothetical protein MONOS_2012 [Monocercomonoides exilis]|eukprot:MONOS_2012.1-p1 / transcript=MONOS_2012.1 / gene=MONOS_2012 / organism=Monocercomonoides_exilis_PA203 / gene_product=unspecified product / transcript_product=unspecified product / location=Mono_scaffold00039:15986-17231(-) / protein_length=394 / sequence_SO=supercontig / SO=protein_coding / is_pseudo=false